jgi:hypothetical protein
MRNLALLGTRAPPAPGNPAGQEAAQHASRCAPIGRQSPAPG